MLQPQPSGKHFHHISDHNPLVVDSLELGSKPISSHRPANTSDNFYWRAYYFTLYLHLHLCKHHWSSGIATAENWQTILLNLCTYLSPPEQLIYTPHGCMNKGYASECCSVWSTQTATRYTNSLTTVTACKWTVVEKEDSTLLLDHCFMPVHLEPQGRCFSCYYF